MAGITGLLSYQRAQKASQRKALEKAIQQRQQRAYRARPSEVYAVPMPVHTPVTPPTQAELDADEQENNPMALPAL